MQQKNCSIFKNYFSSLALNLISKLPSSPNISTESKVASYYDNNAVSKDLNFQLFETSPEKILKLVSAIFNQIFIFSPNDSPSKTKKNVFYFI